MRSGLTFMFVVAAMTLAVIGSPGRRTRQLEGINVRITWEGIVCALGSSPCDFVQKYLYQVEGSNEWIEFKPAHPVSVYRYGDDCEFIIRNLHQSTKLIRIQLLDESAQVLADTGPLQATYQTVIHPFADKC